MNDFDKKQTEMLEKLQYMQISTLLGYKIDKLLFNITGESIKASWAVAIKETIKRLVCNFYQLSFNVVGEDILMVSFNYRRKDHTDAWNKYKSLFSEYDELEIEGSGFKKENLIPINQVLSSTVNLVFHYRQLGDAGNCKEKLVLAAHLTELCRLEKALNVVTFNQKVMVQYFDGAEYENFITQFLKQKGLKTVVLQHGLPVFRSATKDRLNQSVILNFSSDYIVVTGKYVRQQCKLGGISDSNIEVLGTLRCIEPLQDNNKNCFTIFLDCPNYINATLDNSRLIILADNLAQKVGMSFVIKCHPQDKPENYDNMRLENGKFGVKDITIAETLENASFAILHVSGVYLDILAYGIKPFCLVNDTLFPLVEFDLDLFSSIQELQEKMEAWNKFSCIEKMEYFDRIVDYYLSPKNAEERNRSFLKMLASN